MNRDRRLYESVNHSMMANFVDDGFKDEEVQVNESNNKGPTGFSALKYVQPTDVTPGYSTVSDADIVVLRYASCIVDDSRSRKRSTRSYHNSLECY